MRQYGPGIGPVPTNYSLFTGYATIKSFAIEYMRSWLEAMYRLK